MFKRLRERLQEEANKAVGQHAFGNNSAIPADANAKYSDKFQMHSCNENAEDLITVSESSAIIVPYSSSDHFSIADEEGSLSEQNTPEKKLVHCSAGSELYSTSMASGKECGDLIHFSNFTPVQSPPYVPQTDIESEVEQPPTLNLEGISKEQLLFKIDYLKARQCKYKNKYSEVVSAYKNLHEEKQKLEHTLTENQDRSLRRIAELREQCQLEQKAKAHLEENLRLILEEKDSRISVLQTQINLLKETHPDNDGSDNNTKIQATIGCMTDEVKLLDSATDSQTEKILHLSSLLKECETNMISQSEKIKELSIENSSLEKKLEALSDVSNAFEESQEKLRSEHEMTVKSLKEHLDELKRQQEDNVMSMAETKRNMHQELELRERQISQLKEEAKQLQLAIDQEKARHVDIRKQCDDKVNELQAQLENVEKDKQSFMDDFRRGKSEAITLMQKENAKKIAAIEEEWKTKFEDLEIRYKTHIEQQDKRDVEDANEDEEKLKVVWEEEPSVKEKDYAKKLHEVSSQCNLYEAEHQKLIEEFQNEISQLKKQHNVEMEKYIHASALSKEFKSKLDQQEHEFQFEMQQKSDEIEKLGKVIEEKEKILSQNLADTELIRKLENNMSSAQFRHDAMVDELNQKVKQLQQEKEQLIIDAQERVIAIESKCDKDISMLNEKIQQLQLGSKENEQLKLLNYKLSKQLDESFSAISVCGTNIGQEISGLRNKLRELEGSFSMLQDEQFSKQEEMKIALHKLVEMNIVFESIQQAKTNLEEQIGQEKTKLKEQVQVNKSLAIELSNLETKNSSLQNELDAMYVRLEVEKGEQNLKIQSLELLNKKLSEDLNFIRTENEVLKDDIQNVEGEICFLKEENESLRNKIQILKDVKMTHYADSKLCNFSSNEMLQKKYEEKLLAKEEELERLKETVKELSVQINREECNGENNFNDGHNDQIRNAALNRQDVWEKDCALEEIREHYELLLKEKESRIKELESRSSFSQPCAVSEAKSEAFCSEPSDWDDTWVVPEETCENSSSAHSEKVSCDQHLTQIESMQEELDKRNSEINDLRILLRLSPPQAFNSNNTFFTSNCPSLPEPTEIEYLKNILFEYMMGKETETLVKVIAAVLKFSEEQTKMVIEKEKTKYLSK